MTIKQLYEETRWLIAEGYAGEQVWVEDPDDFNHPRRAKSIRAIGDKIYIDQEDTTE